MKNNIFILFIKAFFKNKKNIFNFLLLSTLIVLLSILSCYFFITKNYLTNEIVADTSYKLLYVETNEENDIGQSIKNKLLEIEHVNAVYNSNYYYNGITSEEFQQTGLSGMIELYSSTNNTIPSIVKGYKFPDEHGSYLICPMNFYPNGSSEELTELNKSHSINLSDNIGDTYTFTYPDLYSDKMYTIDLKLVGLYKNSNSNIDESTCYTTEDVLYEIFYNQNKNDEYYDENVLTNFFVHVDEIENIENVKKQINQLGYISENVFTINYSYFNKIFHNISLTFLIIIVLILIIMIIINYKNNKDNYSFYQTLNYIGYHQKDIYLISSISSFLLILMSSLIGFSIIFIIKVILKYYISYYPFFLNKWPLIYNFSLSYIVITVLIIFSFLLNIFICRRGIK